MLAQPSTNDEIVSAEWLKYEPKFARVVVKKTGAQLAGLRYESAALRHLASQHKMFVPKPWFMYWTSGGPMQWCQPDGVLFEFLLGRIVVIECKIRHTDSAFRKLCDVYVPVLRTLFPKNLWSIAGVEVTRAYDCAVATSVKAPLYRSVMEVPEDEFGAVVWK